MMDGIYAEKSGEFWVVKDTKTSEVVSIGNTISDAVLGYETILANEQIAKEIGMTADDFDI